MHGGGASPRTRALEVLIKASLEQMSAPRAKTSESLLFMGSWQDAHPRLLLLDPVLEPVDKIVWQVIKLQAAAGGGAGFPSYEEIARWANVASDATVSRAVAILRLTRWLTLCVRVRDARGRNRGNVYALHDEPLSLADTLHLDPEYMEFLYSAPKHHHGRVRDVATAVVQSLELDIAEGIDVVAPTDALMDRMSAMHYVQTGKTQPDRPNRFGSMRHGVITDLRARPPKDEESPVRERDTRTLDLFEQVATNDEIHRLQNLKSVPHHPLQNLKSVAPLQILKPGSPQNLIPRAYASGSCSSSNKDTTTTARSESPEQPRPENTTGSTHSIPSGEPPQGDYTVISDGGQTGQPQGVCGANSLAPGQSEPEPANSRRLETGSLGTSPGVGGPSPERAQGDGSAISDGRQTGQPQGVSPGNSLGPGQSEPEPASSRRVETGGTANSPGADSSNLERTRGGYTVTSDVSPSSAPTTPPLVYPQGISDNERRLAERYLASVDSTMRQAVLDAWSDKIQQVNQGFGSFLRSSMAYFGSLCAKARRGEFNLPEPPPAPVNPTPGIASVGTSRPANTPNQKERQRKELALREAIRQRDMLLRERPAMSDPIDRIQLFHRLLQGYDASVAQLENELRVLIQQSKQSGGEDS